MKITITIPREAAERLDQARRQMTRRAPDPANPERIVETPLFGSVADWAEEILEANFAQHVPPAETPELLAMRAELEARQRAVKAAGKVIRATSSSE
jgi:hypothetical protein